MRPLFTKATYVTMFNLIAMSSALASVSDGANDAQPNGTPTSLFAPTTNNGHTTPSAFQSISNILIYIVGAVAVIMLIIGGLRYVISQGDAAEVKAAKDTILYGIIGVVVAVLAYAIVNFIIGTIK